MNSRLIVLTALGALSIGLTSCNGSKAAAFPGANPVSPYAAPVANPVTPTGTYVQIERLSRPAVKELFENFSDHATTNALEPYNTGSDPLYTQIKSFTDTVRPPGTGAGAPQYGTTIRSILYPDEMSANLASSSATAGYLGVETGLNSFGGRDPGDDVIGTSLGVVFGATLTTNPGDLGLLADDGEENNCLSTEHVSQDPSQHKTTTFPYLAGPH